MEGKIHGSSVAAGIAPPDNADDATVPLGVAGFRIRALNTTIFLTSLCVTFDLLARTGFEVPWYRLSVAIASPAQLHDAYAHRVLFIGIARMFELLAPGLGARAYFYLSQLVALAFTFFSVRLLARQYVSEAWDGVASVLLVVMLAPMFLYFNFYDIGLVGFHALCLALLLQRRYAWYLVTYAIGLTNHENVLLLAGVAFVWLWQEHQMRQAVTVAGAQLLIFILYRLAVRYWMPGDIPYTARLHENLHAWSIFGTVLLLKAALPLVLPMAGVIVCFRRSPVFLKTASAVLFAGLMAVTMLVGRLVEARQWMAILAVAVPMMVTALAESADGRVDGVKA